MYEHALKTFVELPDALGAEAIKRTYEEQLFPLARARLRPNASERVDQLFLTAGGQHYSVTLSLEATPASEVIFLVTPESQPSAEAAAALALGPEVRRRYERVDKVDAASVYQAIMRSRGGFGDRPPRIAVDITSGTKAMTAAASSAAVVLGAQLRYIESEQIRNRSFNARERVHTIPHPLQVMGDLQRQEAERLFDRLAFDRAAAAFAELDLRGAPGYRYRDRQTLAEAYAEADALRFEKAASLLDEVARRLQGSALNSHDPLSSAAKRIAQQAAMHRLLAEKAPTELLIRFFVAYAARREAQGLVDAAALVHYRTIELAVQHRLATHGIDAGRARPEVYQRAAERAGKTIEEIAHALGVDAAHVPDKLPLMQGWTVLLALGDPLGQAVEKKKLQGQTEVRNHSIFAHGHKPLQAENLRRFVETAGVIRGALARIEGWTLPSPDPEMDFVRFADLPEASM